MRETRGSAGSGETGRERTHKCIWDKWDENVRSTRFGHFGRNWNSGPTWTWDIWDKKFRRTRFGQIGRKWESSHFLTLGHLGQKVPTGPRMGQFRGFRPIGEQLALSYLGQ
ncbi:hypothetical protein KI387_007885, partial [Taxus chinensis]